MMNGREASCLQFIVHRSSFIFRISMSHRIFNFSAGPAMLPTEVLEKSAAALLDYQGKGFGIGEVSHRGKEFEAVNDEAISRCKKLLGLGDTHDVIFLQGGATQ